MPAKETMVRIVRNALLAFVLITIGFAIGRESERRSARTGTQTALAPLAAAGASAVTEHADRVVVYYAHTTFRCITCNSIEEMAHGVLTSQFADELASGAAQWQSVNFQDDEAFAKRYEIVSSCVVVVGMKGDGEIGFRRLDEVWTLVKDPPAFEKYIADAVREFLPEEERGSCCTGLR